MLRTTLKHTKIRELDSSAISLINIIIDRASESIGEVEVDLHPSAPMVMDKVALIRSTKENDSKDELRQRGEFVEQLDFHNVNVFAWSANDMLGIDPPVCQLQRFVRRGPRPFLISSRAHDASNRRNRGLTLKFTVPRQVHFRIAPFTRVDLLSVDSIEGHNQVSSKGFPTTGPRIEAGNVVIHRGLHVSNVIASCSLCAIGYKELFTDRHRCPDVLYIVVMLMGYVVDCNCMLMDFTILRLGVSFGITGLIRASFGITRLICASFGITKLICASFGITRLIVVSFGVTRLIRASFGITRLMCKGTARGRPTRGKKDA
ncbi:hypothetical protein E6C27_scaffold61G001130 [Cucumis melo var. makuwa]|uniref:Mucin-19-like n=1 Tax=Cucumis melo var. makuwa TaxID=1194695 RepID=A0A5A7U4Y3_CUCMM|nr:hypothetical protein E6C27_scaffold61G001130 [Cucumis melo var. makuwa]